MTQPQPTEQPAEQARAEQGYEPEPPEDAPQCVLPEVEPREFPAGFDPARVRAILVSSDKWVNGTVLRYHFMNRPPNAEDMDVVRDAFRTWEQAPIGIRFQEVADPNEAEVRIRFDHADGSSWSYVGRQVLDRPATEPTMGFGWQLSGWAYGRDTALHEIGHTLGLPHEHQNPNAGIVWNEPAVLEYFGGPPNNWPPEVTRWNILRKISPDTVQGSTWDRDSIMHYQFRAGLIEAPEAFRTQPLIPEPGLSARDTEWIRTFYPPTEEEPERLRPFQSRQLNLAPAEQADFVVEVPATRRYTFQTFGSADTVMVLFENVQTGPQEGRGLRYLAGDDESGTDLNARFDVKLYKGREYVLRIRLYWAWATGETAVMMW